MQHKKNGTLSANEIQMLLEAIWDELEPRVQDSDARAKMLKWAQRLRDWWLLAAKYDVHPLSVPFYSTELDHHRVERSIDHVDALLAAERDPEHAETLMVARYALMLLGHQVDLGKKEWDPNSPTEDDLCLVCRLRIRLRYFRPNESLPDGYSVRITFTRKRQLAKRDEFLKYAWSWSQKLGETDHSFNEGAGRQLALSAERVRMIIKGVPPRKARGTA